ncbi:GNAT family N-acetyltransferase [Clostridium sp. 19966]|uniref:GNAT family N-acetyltransferase n=1 Tax=Clostridium sp. 19966 TaxID=2768166 RepID=UPI0028DFE099|nr:GNAT family N-acetyltransferase [Clostridium sp. 19966]MDT8718360.1 GNAT family N-acetyltransferase [Clostridium sp. 19966]
MIIIETERLLVRNFKAEDWKDLQDYLLQKEIYEFEREWDTSDEAVKKSVDRFSEGNVFWAVELKKSSKMVGHIYFNKTEPEDFMTWELGYIFNPKYQGNGYATEACKALLQYAFERLNAHRIVADCNPENTKSWRLMERLSMRREGHYLKSATFKKTEDGKPIWWDGYEYGILEEEWQTFPCSYRDK